MIPIPVETETMLAILNLPKEMSNNGIFKEHQGLVLEMIHSLVLQEHYDRATHDDLPEEEQRCSFTLGELVLTFVNSLRSSGAWQMRTRRYRVMPYGAPMGDHAEITLRSEFYVNFNMFIALFHLFYT